MAPDTLAAMGDWDRVGRRGFLGGMLGTSAAIAVGAGLGSQFARASSGATARFNALGGFPDRPLTVDVRLPDTSTELIGRAWLHIETPNEAITRDLGTVRFHRGAATIATALIYPYETRVPGRYAYHVEVAAGRHRILTEEPAGYSVRKIWWFS